MNAVVQLYRALGGDWMGSSATAATEYYPMGQNGAQSSQRTAGRYTTRPSEDAPDPDAEWRERRERSRERVAMALQEDTLVGGLDEE